jgi:cell fate regulator YaaT (PSP1 superfamily)
MALLPLKRQDELRAVALCSQKLQEHPHLQQCMQIVDAEFQFDRHKLTFFFESRKNVRVDFRALVCDLFTTYKTRIWMQQVEVIHSRFNQRKFQYYSILLDNKIKLFLHLVEIIIILCYTQLHNIL